uniref:CUB domain-containing protein n=1 Tax=Sinocyclocheilus rhinocerous TaxID=307959 RepID=A0A673MBN3_9TELE
MEQQEQQILATGRAVQTLITQVSDLTTQFRQLRAEAAQRPTALDSATASPVEFPSRRAEPRLPPPTVYSGEPLLCRSFLATCSLHIALQPSSFPTEESKVAFVITLLTGRAALWGTAVWERKHQCCSSFQSFSDELRKVFDRATSGREAARELAELRQGDRSVTDYAIEFRTLAAECNWNQEAQWDVFRHGLADRITNEIYTLELPTSLDGLIDLAIRVDNRLRRRDERTLQVSAGRSGDQFAAPTKGSSDYLSGPEPMQVSRARFSREEKERRRNRGLCSYCGATGHVVACCPVKAKVFRSPTGEFSPPNYPDNYPNNRECVYKIIVEVNMQIMLNVTDFELEGLSSCGFDYLEIRYGGYETSPLIGKYCGTNGPPIIVSHSNRLWLKFRSDHSLTYRGFRAHWDGCGGILTTSVGGFTSPNYPLPYHTNAECYWHIKTSAGSTVELRFGDFHLENSMNCFYDYLVYDGDSTSAPQMAKLCGNEIPAPISSSRQNMYVKLRTDSIIHTGGFLATYQTSELHRTPGLLHLNQNFCCALSCGSLIKNRQRKSRSTSLLPPAGCGGELIGPTGAFTSPGYPDKYPANRECIWHIQTSPGSSISITILEFDVEYHPDCNYDKLEVWPDLSSPRLAQLCTTRPPNNPLQVASTGNAVTVRFTSDAVVSGRGFSSTDNCRFFYLNYPDNVDCSWVITVDVGHRVFFNFTDLDVESHSSCGFDYVIHDGPHESSPLLGRYCGNELPHSVTSFSNALVVNFISDASVGRKGFRATYMASTSGAFNSPNYPDVYPPNVECVWTITSSPGNRLQLSFISDCSNDYLEVREGHSTGTLVGRFCGDSLPSNYTSIMDHILWIKFVSDSSVSGAGFRAVFSHCSQSNGLLFSFLCGPCCKYQLRLA